MNDLNAVHDDDLEGFLEKLGILDDVLAGKVKCKFCGMPVGLESLHAVFPDSGDVKVVCVEIECIAQLTEYLDKK